MWVKICANTNLEDAALAAQLGADAVGFVFAASRRRVTAEQVRGIIPALPGSVERIGVFDVHTPDEIANAVLQAGLSAVQVHRELDQAGLQQLRRALSHEVEIIPTVHWKVEDSSAADAVAGRLRDLASTASVRRVLIDSKVDGASGGTGIRFDWHAARQVFLHAAPTLDLILAGGLTPETVAEAIQELRPFGVDVASGVESKPGRKDPVKLRQFIRNVRSARID